MKKKYFFRVRSNQLLSGYSDFGKVIIDLIVQKDYIPSKIIHNKRAEISFQISNKEPERGFYAGSATLRASDPKVFIELASILKKAEKIIGKSLKFTSPLELINYFHESSSFEQYFIDFESQGQNRYIQDSLLTRTVYQVERKGGSILGVVPTKSASQAIKAYRSQYDYSAPREEDLLVRPIIINVKEAEEYRSLFMTLTRIYEDYLVKEAS